MAENSAAQSIIDRILAGVSQDQNTQIANEVIPEPFASLLRSLGIGQETFGRGAGAILDTMTGANQAPVEEQEIDPFEFDPVGKIQTILGISEMLGQRRDQGEQPRDFSGLLDRIAAPGQEFNMGFNPGGIADILAGIISGQGTQAGMESGLISDDIRRANVIPVEQLLIGGTEPAEDPGLAADIGSASDLLATLLGQPTRAQQQQTAVISAIQNRGRTPAPQFNDATAIGL